MILNPLFTVDKNVARIVPLDKDRASYKNLKRNNSGFCPGAHCNSMRSPGTQQDALASNARCQVTIKVLRNKTIGGRSRAIGCGQGIETIIPSPLLLFSRLIPPTFSGGHLLFPAAVFSYPITTFFTTRPQQSSEPHPQNTGRKGRETINSQELPPSNTFLTPTSKRSVAVPPIFQEMIN